MAKGFFVWDVKLPRPVFPSSERDWNHPITELMAAPVQLPRAPINIKCLYTFVHIFLIFEIASPCLLWVKSNNNVLLLASTTTLYQ
jgi:hypothetical protein